MAYAVLEARATAELSSYFSLGVTHLLMAFTLI